jgi:hypothetical protein
MFSESKRAEKQTICTLKSKSFGKKLAFIIIHTDMLKKAFLIKKLIYNQRLTKIPSRAFSGGNLIDTLI